MNILSRLLIFLALVVLVSGCGEQQGQVTPPEQQESEFSAMEEAMKMKPLIGKNIAMIIARNNFRDEEFLKPREILENAGAEITIASSSLGAAAGMLGAKVMIDKQLKDIDVSAYDAVVFVGGTGASEFWDDATAHQIANETVAQDKVLAAICIAPVTLARAGVLKDKKATVWHSEQGKITSEGCTYTASAVEVDGKIITANGPTSAEEFGNAIIDALSAK